MTNEQPLDATGAEPAATPSAADIQAWLIDALAEELQVAPDEIRVDEPILAQGIDSMHVVAIVAQLEDWLGIRFSSNPLEDFPTIEALAQSLGSGDDTSRPHD